MHRLVCVLLVLCAGLLGVLSLAGEAQAAMAAPASHHMAPEAPCPDHAPQTPAAPLPFHALTCCLMACLSSAPEIALPLRRPVLPRAGLGKELLALNPIPYEPPPRLSHGLA